MFARVDIVSNGIENLSSKNHVVFSVLRDCDRLNRLLWGLAFELVLFAYGPRVGSRRLC